jgi:hypothetical protein
MDDNLPIIYLSGLLILLAGLAVFVIRQILKTRSLESTFAKLQRKLSSEKGSSQEVSTSTKSFISNPLVYFKKH